jgi:hypothetical protein
MRPSISTVTVEGRGSPVPGALQVPLSMVTVNSVVSVTAR